VGLLEAVGGGDGAVVVVHAALLVAHPVQRRHEVLHEAGVLLEHAEDGVDLDVLVAGELRDPGEVGEVLEDEADVAQGRRVLSHGREGTGRPQAGGSAAVTAASSSTNDDGRASSTRTVAWWRARVTATCSTRRSSSTSVA